MRRRILVVLVGAGALAALVACFSAGTPGEAPSSTAAPSPVEAAPGALAGGQGEVEVKAPLPEAAPAPGNRSTPAADTSEPAEREIPRAGVALAESYRNDLCACATKACWLSASRAYRDSVGLAVPKSPEEARVIDAAMREAASCIRRIDAAEAAAREAAAPDADSPG